jgi:hypothetical protein
MRKILLFAALAACVATSAFAIKLYQTEDEAKARCHSEVVWLNAKTMIYHMPGTKGYGSTKEGAFVCQKAADHAGARPAMNGQ